VNIDASYSDELMSVCGNKTFTVVLISCSDRISVDKSIMSTIFPRMATWLLQA